ncbi:MULTISPECIES: ABC transporter permease [Cohaesibacter]|uniref:ABC transporter permease n=1 Tax=Cohaesibacter TaxID=655352 RepID=UPI000DEB660C|nr:MULTISPECIES: ABC transporter permease [Cohaesibacter]TLP48176.1 ABC transporter permease [Cohaesibacter sp. CAU 1516]
MQTQSSKFDAAAMLRRFPFLPALGILLLLIVLNGIAEPNSLTIRAMKGVVSTYLALVFLSVAQTFVVYGSDIDLSVGAILSLVNVSMIVIMNQLGGGPFAVLLACFLGIFIGALCGLFNGLMVAGLRLQPIVATFATSILISGIALWVLPVAGLPAPSAFWKIYGGRSFGIPNVFFFLTLLVGLLVVIAKTKLVTKLLAVGNGQLSAYQSGLPVTRIRISGYVICGIFSAFAAMCITGDTASGDPLVGGAMTLSSVAAVVLGGTALSGGAGSAFGSAIGALIIGLISSLVFYAGTPSEWQNLVQGATILAVLMLGVLASRRINK